jgi:hypothetical protein
MTPSELTWLKVLRGSCLYVLVTGLLPSLAVFEATQEPWRLFFDLLTWPLDFEPATFTDSERQLSAVLGGVLCAWAILMYQLSHPSVFNPIIRTLMVRSVWVWFALDSLGSVISGLPLNAVSNAVFLVLLLLPLAALKTARDRDLQ